MKRIVTYKQMIALMVIICLFTTIIFRPMNVKAADTTTIINGDGSQTVVSGSNDEIYNITFNKDKISIVGKHAKSNATYSYLTLGFNISLDRNTSSGEVPYKDNKKVFSILIDKPEDKIQGDTVITTYEIDKEWFYESVAGLLINQYNWNTDEIEKAFLSKDGVKVYLSNIFCMVKRTGGSTSEVIERWGKYQTLTEIMNAPVSSGIGEWGAETKKVLPHYYGMEITLKNTAYELDIEYYDTVNKKVVGKNESFMTYMQGITDTITPPYTVVAGKSQVTFDNMTYNLKNSSTHTYDGYSNKQTYDSFTPKITFDKPANSTLRIDVEPSETECKVKIQYVDESKRVIKDNIDGGGFNNGEEYSYDSYEEKPFIDSKAYEYTKSWSYSYTNKAGAKKEGSGTGTPKFKLSDVKPDTTVLLKLVYKENKNEEVVQEDSIDYFEPSATGVIKADNRGAEKFEATAGVPTTESLYANVLASEYLINAKFNIVEKTVYVPISVTKVYAMQWYQTLPQTAEEIKNGVLPKKVLKQDPVTVTKVVSVERAYKYTEIKSIDYFNINQAVLNNGALPGSSIALTPVSYSVPSLNYQHYSGEDAHLIYPSQMKDGIVLSPQTVPPNGDSKASVPVEDFASLANSKTDQFKVRNDYMEFGGKVVLDNNYVEKTASDLKKSSVPAPKTISNSVLYDSNLTIEATKSNGIYSSSGSITYEQVTGFQSSKGPSLSYSVNSINNVIIHTPVYCKADLINDNKKYVQLVNPNIDCIPIVLDEDGISSDFIVDISNFGYHSSMFGYGSRDYSINMLGDASYIASKNGVLRNEVKFPFDVYIDIGNDNKTANDKLISAETWYTVGLNKYRFYVPMYVKEGIYTVEFRSIAVNGTSRLTATEVEANKSRLNYVATDSMQVQISGKIQGLTIYDIGDYPLWKDIFRVNKSTKLKLNVGGIDGTMSKIAYGKSNLYYYTVGTNNQYGISTGRSIKYTFPLIAGSHPQYANQGALKAGYTWRFTLDSIGDVMEQDDSYIVIEPRFYYVDKAGKNREEVDLYYSETIQGSKKTIVKVGSTLDKKNVKTAKVGDVGLAIPINELKLTAGLRNTSYAKWITNVNAMYSYHGITSSNSFKTFSNSSYTDRILSSNSGQDLLNNGITEAKLIKLKQSYYFNYMLPNTVKAVTKGKDVASYAKKYGITYKENFWKTEGYLIININITAYDGKGNAYLSYINTSNYQNYGHNSMWLLEGAQAKKTDYYGTEFTFEVGDFLMINVDKTSVDDYRPGGIY